MGAHHAIVKIHKYNYTAKHWQTIPTPESRKKTLQHVYTLRSVHCIFIIILHNTYQYLYLSSSKLKHSDLAFMKCSMPRQAPVLDRQHMKTAQNLLKKISKIPSYQKAFEIFFMWSDKDDTSCQNWWFWWWEAWSL